MTTINLYQNHDEDLNRRKARGVNSGFFFSLGILVVTLLVLFGLKFYIPTVDNQNKAIALVIKTENDKLVGLKNLEQIVDVQTRLAEIKSNLEIKEGAVTRTRMTQILDNVGAEMNKGVVISSYKYTKDKVNMTFGANNFSDISKQILNLKKSQKFSDVNLVSVARGESGISCDVEMKVVK